MLRLFDDREDEFRTCNISKEIIKQYDYAYENLEYLRQALNQLSTQSKRSSFYTGAKGHKQRKDFHTELLMRFAKSAIITALFYFFMTWTL